MSAQEMTERHLDSLVWEALPADGYRPFADLRNPASGIPADGREIRASLVRLMEQGLAELKYGHGFRQLRRVVPGE